MKNNNLLFATLCIMILSTSISIFNFYHQVQVLSLGSLSPHRAGPAEIYPLSSKTPGVTNPAITQATIAQTICNLAWSTKSIRPAVSYTNTLKIKQIAQYGYTDTKPSDYEEDHLISLELGGSPTDPANLWPQPYNTSVVDGGAKSKDSVENFLHREVCSGTITLATAQKEITADWYSVYKQMQGNLGSITGTGISDVDVDDN